MTAFACDVERSIESFAELSARMHDPFADRVAILERAGLSDAKWHLLVTTWSDALGHDTDEARRLAEQFGEAYSAMALRLSTAGERRHELEVAATADAAVAAESPAKLDVDAGHMLSSVEQEASAPRKPPLASDAATSPALPSCLLERPPPPAEPRRSRPLFETAPVELGLWRPAVPFRPDDADPTVRPRPPRAAALADRASWEAVPRTQGSRRPALETTELRPAASDRERPPLPFSSTSPQQAPAKATTDGKRLLLFDPQTGERLASPRWVDVTPPREGSNVPATTKETK